MRACAGGLISACLRLHWHINGDVSASDPPVLQGLTHVPAGTLQEKWGKAVGRVGLKAGD